MSRPRKRIAENRSDIRICIIEDHAIVRAGLKMLVEQEGKMEVVCEASTASEALSIAARTHPDIVLLDISLRTENGLDYLPALLRALAPARVVVLTALEDTAAHLRAMEGGASGVVMKDQAPEVLVQAIHAVNLGEAWIGRTIAVAAIAKLSRARAQAEYVDPEAVKIAQLTAREREIITIVARGYNGTRIASELKISEATVRHHITSILSKLDLSNKLELAVYALQNKLGPEPTNHSS